MPARAIWKGAISFGMVAIPIKLFAATDSKDIRFVNLHSACSTRLRQKRVCPEHDVEVSANEVTKGYEYAKGQYVLMDEADFEDLPVSSKHTIEITQFVDLPSIDPVYFERSYLLEPDGVGLKPYALLKGALEATSRVAIGKIAMRSREHLCAIRPYNGAMMMATMHFPDEIRGTADLDLPEELATVTKPELKMATALVDQLTGPFEPEQYEDEYRGALERMIEAKLGAAEPVTAAAPTPKGKVGDLMEALKASIESAKAERAVTTKATKAKKTTPRKRVRKAS